MPGRLQSDALARLYRAGALPTPPNRFERLITGSHYVHCTVCGERGLGEEEPTPQTILRWQLVHMTGHPYQCECGAAFITAGQWASHAVEQRPLHTLAVHTVD